MVTHNSSGHAGRCLDSLKDQAEVIVVDNASADSTLDEVSGRPWVRIIANHENRGFAAAVNQGVRATGAAEFLLIFNPDAILERGLDLLATACERHGIAAGKLVGEDRQVQVGFTIRRLPTPAALSLEVLGINRLWPSNPVNRRYRYLDRDHAVEGGAEQPAGAFLMVRRDVFENLGGFDEDFFPVWFEDVDFAKRASEAGIRPRYLPLAVARHAGAHSVGRMHAECRPLVWYASLLRYAAKHFTTIQFRVVCGAVAASSLLRVVAGIFGERKTGVVYRRVLRLAGASLSAGRLCSESIQLKRWSDSGAAPVASHSAQR